MIRRVLLQQRIALRTSYIYPVTRTISTAVSPIRPSQSNIQTVNIKYYSTEPEVSNQKKSENCGESEKNEEKGAEALNSKEEDSTLKELESKNREIIDLKDRYLRSVAEFRNLQERAKRDMQAARDFSIQNFAKDLLESIDNLDRALSMVPQEKLINPDTSEDSKDLISLYEGLKMTEEVLMNTLKKNGLIRFDPSIEGAKFDPNEHEATFMVPMEGKEDNTVFVTQQKGFKLNGRVLRAAKVGVVKNS